MAEVGEVHCLLQREGEGEEEGEKEGQGSDGEG